MIGNGWRKTYRSPNKRGIGDGVDDGERTRLLLLGLAASGADPAEDDGVDSVGSDGEDNHGEVPGAGVEGGAAQDEAEDGDGLGDGDVPGALVEFTGGSGPEDGDEAGNEVRWAGEDEGDGAVEAEGLDGGGEEVLESVGGQVHVLHECEKPEFGVAGGLQEALDARGRGLVAHGVALDAVVCELALFRSEPFGVEGVVGEGENSAKGDDEGRNTLDDEEPAPAGETGHAVHLEDAESNQAGECSGEDVAGVEDGNAGRDFLAGVENGEHE